MQVDVLIEFQAILKSQALLIISLAILATLKLYTARDKNVVELNTNISSETVL